MPGVLPEPVEPQEPPFPPGPVEELLRLLAKAARAQQLYLPNNPIYRGAIDALRAGFVAVWKQTDELPLSILETDIRWYDAIVAGDPSAAKSIDNLAWLFHKDGVRELTFLHGVETEEIGRLLQIIQRVRKANADEDDLVTMLWEADFTFLRYKYVDLLQDGTTSELADGYPIVPIPSSGEIERATREAVSES